MRRDLRRASLLLLVMLGGATPARAQFTEVSSSPCRGVPSTRQLFTGTLRDFRYLSSRESLGIMALGGIGTAGAHVVDGELDTVFAEKRSLRNAFRAGAVVGGTPLELGAAFAAYGIGRALNKPCAASLGADLVQAQLMAEALAIAGKQATRRARPEGSGFSFPSGHATVTFASATVLQQHFGWKVGIPAYAVASYVAASRVQMKRHYLSDVTFGAALGIIAGRTVTVGRRRQLLLSPIVAPSSTGAGVGFTLIGKK